MSRPNAASNRGKKCGKRWVVVMSGSKYSWYLVLDLLVEFDPGVVASVVLVEQAEVPHLPHADRARHLVKQLLACRGATHNTT